MQLPHQSALDANNLANPRVLRKVRSDSRVACDGGAIFLGRKASRSCSLSEQEICGSH
jgi:hypothetical protein